MSASALPSALVNSIENGAYPDSEDIVSSEVKADSLRSSLELVKREKGTLEDEIRALSQNNVSSVDDWLSKARELSIDIEKAKAVAREIVTQNETRHELSSKIEDARAKYGLLKVEIDFNDEVIHSLNVTKKLQLDLALSTERIAQHDFVGASVNILEVGQQLEYYGQALGIGTVDITRRKLSNARDSTIERLQAILLSMIKIDPPTSGSKLILSYLPKVENLGTNHSFETVVDALENLNALDRTVDRLSFHLERKILKPALSRNQFEHIVIHRRDESSLESFPQHGPSTTSNVIESLSIFLNFLQGAIPASVSNKLTQRILPNLVSSIVNDWLTPSIPLGLSELCDFDAIQRLARDLSNSLPQTAAESKEQLADWADRAPRLWISKRRMAALDRVRHCFKTSKGVTKTVERVERQTVSKREQAFVQDAADSGRNPKWEDDKDLHEPTAGKFSTGDKDDEDESGWGFDDDNESAEPDLRSHNPEKSQDRDEADNDAWGWGNDTDANIEERTNQESTKLPQSKAVNGHTSPQGVDDASEREIVLKETYTITDVPETILDIIKRQIEDAQTLRTLDNIVLDKATSLAGLLSLPTLVLAMYRATASAFYASGMIGGQMHLYNDCLFLAGQLRDIASQPDLNKLASDAVTLEKTAKAAYSQEMDTQRVVLGDLLDGAQGFSSCTQQPFAAECETAVTSTVERLRLLHREWQPILSHSALLQSIGSLLARVVDKMTRDIEDMEDISDPESQRLASFCSQVSQLEDIFLPPNAGGMDDQDVVPLTALYIPNWLRFRYLAEILESKLVDIKYLWTKGGLSLEFTAEEVIDLIKALFADSHYRKDAIAAVRKPPEGAEEEEVL